MAALEPDGTFSLPQHGSNMDRDNPNMSAAAHEDDNDDDVAGHQAQRRLHAYFLDQSPIYRKLTALRKKGWESATGDKHFQKQRTKADQPNDKAKMKFYDMTQRIAKEVDGPSRALLLPPGSSRVLDIGMAPGGFLKHALDINPGATSIGITLPVDQSGHEVMLAPTSRADIRLIDVTMLAEDLGMKLDNIPGDHPDANDFLPRQLDPNSRFGLVFCGGVIVRTTKDWPEYRKQRESRRLEASQMSIGLEHITTGGTMVVVMHKLESWRAVYLLWTLSKFCDKIKVIKPSSGHVLRSSFYIVARNVQSRSPEALRAIEEWKRTWKVATFGTKEEYAALSYSVGVDVILEELGGQILQWGEHVWKVQANALKNARFIKEQK